MLYQNIYINFCYLIHPNGMVDFVYTASKNKFIGIPFNANTSFFIDNMYLHRNILTYLTKQQSKLFI
jgi:hypothetical protein